MFRYSFFSKVSLIEWLRGVTQKKRSRHTRPRLGQFHRLGLEFLEDRVAPATFSEGPSNIDVILTSNNETIKIFSKGANLYNFSTTDTANGFVTGGLTFSSFSAPSGSISGDLTVDPTVIVINFLDGAFTGGHIIFTDSGANPYSQDIVVDLTNANAGNIDFFGTSTSNGGILSASTTRGTVTVEAGARVNIVGTNCLLQQTAAGGHVEIDGTITTSATTADLHVNAFGSNGGINEAATGVIKTNAATTSTFQLTGAAGTINLNGGPNDFAGPVVITQSGAGVVTTLDFRNVDPAATLPTLTGLGSLANYTLVTDNTSIPLANSGNLPNTVNFNYSAGSDITEVSALTFPNATFTVLGNNSILLNTIPAGNNIGTVGFNSLKADNTTQVSYLGSAGVNLGVSNLGLGTFNVTAQGAGNITQSGPIVEKIGAAGSIFSLAPAGTGTSITLANTGNRFEGPIALVGPASFTTATLANASLLPTFPTMPASLTSLTLNYPNAPVTLPNLTALLPTLANLTVTAQGVFEQPGTTTLKGNTTSGNATISGLASVAGLAVGQTVTGPGIPPGTTIIAVGTNSITLSQGATATAVGVSLTVTSSITVSSAAILNAGSNPIVLGPTNANNFLGTISVSNAGPNQVVINAAGSLQFGGGSSSLGNGTLTVTTVGNITQAAGIAGRITQTVNAGQTSFLPGPGSGVNLNNGNNQLRGIVDLTTSGGGSDNVTNGVNLNMGTVNITGAGTLTLNVTGNLTQDPGTTISVATSSNLTATGNITLDNDGNVFHGTPSGANFVSVNATNATLRASGGPMNLGASNVTGNFIVRAGGGPITQVGPITGGGNSLFDAGPDVVILTNAANDFTGVTSVVSTGTGIVATFKGNMTNGSNTITNIASTAGLANGQVVIGPGIQAGTTIIGVGATTVTLSQNATATAAGATFTANSPVQLSAAGNIQIGRLVLGTGPGVGLAALILTPGAGSNITEAGATSGITQAPLAGAGSFTMQQGRIDAIFTGNTTSGSTTVSSVSSVAHLVVGQTVGGPGIAPGTTITAIGTTTITLSQAATASGVGVTLTAGFSEIQGLSFSATTGNFAIAFNGEETTILAAGASAAAVQSALVSLPGIGPGNVVVTGAAGNFTVKFQGALANTNVTPLSLVSAGNIVLNTTGNISLNNANNNWTGLVDINAATPGGLTLNNISSINLLGTPAITGTVSLTSGQYVTVPNLAYTLNRFTANAKETAVQQNITTTGNAITFVGTASLGAAGTLLTLNSGGFATNFTGDVFVNTTTGGLTFSSTTGVVNLNQGTWHEGSSPLNITGSGNFIVGAGTTPATFNMVSGAITMGGGNVNVARFSTFEVGDTNVTNTVDTVTVTGAGAVNFTAFSTLSVGLGTTNDKLVDATSNVALAATNNARLTAYSGVTGAVASPVLTASAGTVTGLFAMTFDPNNANSPHVFLMGSDIVTPNYLPNQVTIATGGTVSATGSVTAFEPDSDKYVITASTGAAAKLATAIDVNGLLDVVVRNAPGAVTLTVATTQNLGDGITNLGGIAVDGPGTATITAANTSINTGISFTGNTINGSPTVTNVSNVAGLAIGMPISGPGIPGGATIIAIDPTNFGTATVTLSANATATGAVTLTAADPYADILVQGQLAALTLRDFNGGFAPNFQDFIRAGGLNSQSTTITGRRFDSVSIALPTVLNSLTLADYNNTVGIDTVTAERFGTIKTTGVPLTFVLGDFIVSRLTNLNTLNSTTAGLGTATIANKVTGQFDIQKTVTSVTSKIAQNSSLGLPGGANNPNGDLMGNVTTLNLGQVSTSNIESIGNVATTTAISWNGGTLKANSFATITTTGSTTLPAPGDFGNFSNITLLATGNSAGVGLGTLTVAGDANTDNFNLFNGNVTSITAKRQLLSTVLNAGVVTPLAVIVDPVNSKVGTITAGTIGNPTPTAGLTLNAGLLTTITAIGNAPAGIFGDIINSTVNIQGMPNGAPIFTGVGIGTVNAARNIQGTSFTVVNGSLPTFTAAYQLTNDDVLLLNSAGKLGSLTAGAWNGQLVAGAGHGLVANSIGTITIKGAPQVSPDSSLLIGNLSNVDILAFVNTGATVGIGTFNVTGSFTLPNGGFLRSDNGITTFTVGRDVTDVAGGAAPHNTLISVRNANTGKVGAIKVGRWFGNLAAAFSNVDFVADTIGTMNVTGYIAQEIPSVVNGDFITANFVLLNTTKIDATSITVGFNQNVTNLLAPGGIGALTDGVALLGRVDADNPTGTLGAITTLQAGVIGDLVGSATLRAVTFGTIKTVVNIPLSVGLPLGNAANGAMNNAGDSVTATSTTAAAGIGTVNIASFIAGGVFNVPQTITTFTVAENIGSAEIGAGYAFGQKVATMNSGAIANSVLTANNIGVLNVIGKPITVLNAGVLRADVTNSVITAKGNVAGVGLGTVTVKQKVVNSDFNIAGGNVTAMTVGGIFGSHVLVGAHTAAYDNIVAATAAANWDTLAGVNFTLGSFKTTGLFDPTDVLDTANFRDSFLVAQRFGTVAITGLDPSVPTATAMSGGSPSATFGVAFRGTPPGGAPGPKITVSFSNGNPIPALVTQVLVAPTSPGGSVTITGFGPVTDEFRYVDLAG